MLPSFNTDHSKRYQCVLSYFVIEFPENNEITFYTDSIQKNVCLNKVVKARF